MAVDASPGQAGEQRPFLSTLQELLRLPVGSTQATLSQAAQHLSQVFGADKVDTFVYEPATDTLVALGTSDTPLGRKQKALGLDRLPLSNGGRAVQVYRTRKSLLQGRVDEDPEELLGVREALGVRSQIGVPLHIGGNLRGVLSLTSTRLEYFTPEDLAFAEAVADWVGIAAHRSELVEELTHKAAEEGRQAGAKELVTTLAHEFSNYLAPLKLRIDLLLRRAMKEQRAMDIRDASTAGDVLQRLTRLTWDLLDASRLEQGLFALRMQPVDLAELAHECAGTLGTPESHLKVLGEPQVLVLADPDRIRQVLENLVSNAVKHSPRGVPVTLHVSRQALTEGRACGVLSVIDEGPGIPPELLPRIFERFVAGSRSHGLGLGLYLAHRIATAHGGTLTVQSTPGAGTRFTLSLPLDGEPTKPGPETGGPH
jgi:signal transduction histidine kinase